MIVLPDEHHRPASRLDDHGCPILRFPAREAQRRGQPTRGRAFRQSAGCSPAAWSQHLDPKRKPVRGEHEVTGVVTQPPRRAGRGGKVRATDVDMLARRHELNVLESDDINRDDAAEAIASMRPDVICVVEFGQMIRSHVGC